MNRLVYEGVGPGSQPKIRFPKLRNDRKASMITMQGQLHVVIGCLCTCQDTSHAKRKREYPCHGSCHVVTVLDCRADDCPVDKLNATSIHVAPNCISSGHNIHPHGKTPTADIVLETEWTGRFLPQSSHRKGYPDAV